MTEFSSPATSPPQTAAIEYGGDNNDDQYHTTTSVMTQDGPRSNSSSTVVADDGTLVLMLEGGDDDGEEEDHDNTESNRTKTFTSIVAPPVVANKDIAEEDDFAAENDEKHHLQQKEDKNTTKRKEEGGGESLTTTITVVVTEQNKTTCGCYSLSSWRQMMSGFYQQNEFLILILISIGLAYLYPKLGAVYLYPHITATWIAIILIFLLSGIGLPTTEFIHVLTAWKFHLFIQLFSFGVVSIVCYGFSRLLYNYDILTIELANGLCLVGTLPMTINSAYVLTRCADGDEAAALLNSVVGNMMGIFISPLLLLLYINVEGVSGVGGDNFVTIFIELALRVVLPTFVGQVLQKMTNIQYYMDVHKAIVSRIHQLAMNYMVYAIFCKTFYQKQQNDENNDNNLKEIFLMIAFQLILLVSLMILAWYVLFWAKPKQRVFGLFGCTHKSMAIGILLVDAVFGNEPRPGLYALPLLVYHPMQLVLGTMVVPRLAHYVKIHQHEVNDVPSAVVSSPSSSSSSQRSPHE